MTIEQALLNFRELINSSIISGGTKVKTAMIRSSRPILNIHEAVKSQLIENGVSPDNIFPPLGARTPELKFAGELKQKDQDICVVPNDIEEVTEILHTGLLKGTADKYGKEYTEHSLVINVRSQISSIQKNFDTLYERTYAEASNLHERCPKICLGEVYMIAVPEYDDKSFSRNTVSYKPIKQKLVEKYIKSFSAIHRRTETEKFFYKYEQTCLLIVDFSKEIPKLYNSNEELIADGLLPENTDVSINNLTFNSFVSSLLSIYETRFGTGKLS